MEYRRLVAALRRGSRELALLTGILGVAAVSAVADPPGSDRDERAEPLRLSLGDCIAIAHENQPAIAAQVSAAGAATELKNVARSYFFPQASFQMTYSHLEKPLTINTPNPLSSGPAGDVFSDAAAFFGIARQAGSAVANAALNNPNQPPFSTVKQAVLSAQPSQFQIGVLGRDPIINQILVTQPLFTGGKIKFRNEQADLGVQAAHADVAKSRQTTTFEVTQAYLGIQLTVELDRTLAEAVGQFKATERLIAGLLGRGARSDRERDDDPGARDETNDDEEDTDVTAADLHRVRTVLKLAESERIRVEQNHELALAALIQTMGIDALSEIEITELRLPRPSPREVELPLLVDEALRQRPDLLKARLGVQIAELDRKLAKADYVPDLAAFGQAFSISNDSGYLTNSNVPNYTVGVTLGVPLLTGGRRSANRRKTEFEQSQACQVEKLARSLITLEVQKVYLEFVEAQKRIPPAADAVNEGRATLTELRDQFRGNQVRKSDYSRHFADRITARLLYTQALTEYNKILFLYNLSLAKIQFVTGSSEYETFLNEEPAHAAKVAPRPLGRSHASDRQSSREAVAGSGLSIADHGSQP